jgi:hypothetical protein
VTAREHAISWQSDKRESQERAPIDPQITFANEVVAAMKNRLTEDRAMVGMRQGELS